ncbi:hypothetical protein Syun_020875 [Stephania yunnanensis]|uniref:Uncharacterized protein n=1 Tax=Stephania yunnanensis TaxID=152371 RepID=A0AAP0IFG5_9MAGN
MVDWVMLDLMMLDTMILDMIRITEIEDKDVQRKRRRREEETNCSGTTEEMIELGGVHILDRGKRRRTEQRNAVGDVTHAAVVADLVYSGSSGGFGVQRRPRGSGMQLWQWQIWCAVTTAAEPLCIGGEGMFAVVVELEAIEQVCAAAAVGRMYSDGVGAGAQEREESERVTRMSSGGRVGRRQAESKCAVDGSGGASVRAAAKVQRRQRMYQTDKDAGVVQAPTEASH